MVYLDLLIDIMNRREPDAQYIIVGDFNIPCIEWLQFNDLCLAINYEGRMATELLNMLTCTNMIQINHIKNNYNKTLDLILTNKRNIKCKRAVGIVREDLYHPAISFNFDSTGIKFMKPKKQTKLNFFKSNYTAINEELIKMNWEQLFNNRNINENVDIFYTTIKSLVKTHTPETIVTRDDYPIWYTKQLIELIIEKEHLFKLKKRTQNPIHNLLYKQKRQAIKHEKKKCLREYETNIESKVKSNPKAFFAYTKALHKSNNLPLVMTYKNHISDTLKDTANSFADYFSTVYTSSSFKQSYYL